MANMKTKISTLIFIVVFIGLGVVSAPISAQNGETSQLHRVTLKVDNLSCGGCFATISGALTPLDGYSGMGTNLWRSLVGVDFTDPLTAKQISQVVTNLGYPSTIVDVEPIDARASFAKIQAYRGGCGASGQSGCGAAGGTCTRSGQGTTGGQRGIGGSCCSTPAGATAL